MSYIEKILQPGEVVLSETRLHWFIYLRAIAIIVLAIAVLIVGMVMAPGSAQYFQIAAAVVAFIGLWALFIAWMTRRSTELAVTDRRVIHKAGFLGRTTHEMNREKVESVEVQQSLAGRIFGYGTILVRGVGSSWEPFSHIADPLAFRNSITAAEPMR